jgi:hypothetical protein
LNAAADIWVGKRRIDSDRAHRITEIKDGLWGRAITAKRADAFCSLGAAERRAHHKRQQNERAEARNYGSTLFPQQIAN